MKNRNFLEMNIKSNNDNPTSSIIDHKTCSVDTMNVFKHSFLDMMMTPSSHTSDYIAARNLASSFVSNTLKDPCGAAKAQYAAQSSSNTLNSVVQRVNQSLAKEDQRDFSNQIKQFYPNPPMENFLNNMHSDQINGRTDMQYLSSKYDFNIKYVTDLIYENKLLNYPHLLSKSADSLGFDRAITLSQNLSESFFNEAIDAKESYGEDLILAGLISVDSDTA